MKKLVEITMCEECDKCSVVEAACLLAKRSLFGVLRRTKPEWCPLPNTPEKEAE